LASFTFATISSPQTAGTSFSITITAKDQNGNTYTGYTGTNTLTVSGTGTITPATTTAFVAGVWTGSVTLKTAGTGISISTSGGGYSGTSNTFTVSPGAMASFTMTGYPTTATAGTSFGSSHGVVVTAYDAYGNIATNYVGSVYFTSTDSQATLPYTSGSKYTFTAGDAGTHTFSGTGFTLETAGSQTITVTTGTVSTTSSAITVSVGTLYQFVFGSITGTKTAGTTFSITITAEDQYGNTITTYNSATALTETGPGAGGTVSPPSVTFTSGTYSGSVYVTKSGSLVTITATSGSINTASGTFTVNPGALASFTMTGYPTSVTHGHSFGSSHNVVVTAYDAYGNIATNYRGSVYFTSTDTAATLPYTSTSEYTFTAGDAGTHTFAGTGFTLNTVGSKTITVTTGTVSTTSSTITVS
jgi:hypothetical protein